MHGKALYTLEAQLSLWGAGMAVRCCCLGIVSCTEFEG